jgi:hypothetical protein
MKIEMNDRIKSEYLAGTLSGYLDMTPMSLLLDVIAERCAQETGRRVVQKQRGVVVWRARRRNRIVKNSQNEK